MTAGVTGLLVAFVFALGEAGGLAVELPLFGVEFALLGLHGVLHTIDQPPRFARLLLKERAGFFLLTDVLADQRAVDDPRAGRGIMTKKKPSGFWIMLDRSWTLWHSLARKLKEGLWNRGLYECYSLGSLSYRAR